MAQLGYKVPGTIIREKTRPTTTALSSSQRNTAVVAEFNPKIRITGEPVVKTDALLATQYINKSAAMLGVSNAQITAIAIINGTTWVVGTASEGLRLTSNSGTSFTAITNASTNGGLPSDFITALFYDSGRLYIGTAGGLSYTQDMGLTFTNFTTASTPAIPSNQVNDVFAQGSSIYVATTGGLAISRDGGNSFSFYDSTGSRETLKITFDADTTVTLQNKSWTLYAQSGQEYRVWYNIGGGGTAPLAGPATLVEVDLAAGANAAQVASATAAALNAVSGGTVFLATPNGFTVNVAQVSGGLMPSASTDVDSGFTLNTSTAGANATSGYQEFGLLIPASTSSALNPSTTYSFVVNGHEYRFTTGVSSPLISGVPALLNNADRLDSAGLPVNTGVETLGASITAFQTYTAAIVNEGGGLDDIRITNNSTGASSVVRLNAGVNYADIFQGGKEITDITAINDSSLSLQGKYVRVFSPSSEHYLWFSVGGNGVDPATLPSTIPALDPAKGKRIDIPAINSTAWNALTGANNREKVVSKVIADLTAGSTAFPFIAVAGTAADQFRLKYDLNNVTNTLTSAGDAAGFPQIGTTNWVGAATELPVTFTDAGDLVTCTAHGFVNNQVVKFTSITSTTGISVNTPYYVINAAANTFQVSLSQGGAAIALTTNGTGLLSLAGVAGQYSDYQFELAANAANALVTSGSYFTLTTVSTVGSPATETGFYVWYDDSVNTATDPAPGGIYTNGIRVEVVSGDTADAVATKTRNALNGNGTFLADATVTVVGNVVQIVGKKIGETEVAVNGVGSAVSALLVNKPGVTATTSGTDPMVSVTQFTTAEPYASSGLGGKYFYLNSATGLYGVIFDIESSYKTFTTADVGGGGRLPLPVDLTASDTAATIAQKISTAIASTLSGQFTPSVIGTKVRVTQVTPANVTNASAQTSGFTVTTVKEGGVGIYGFTARNTPVDGQEPVKDVLTVSTLGDVRGLGGSYFLLNSQTAKWVVWYNVFGTNTNEAAAIAAANPGATLVAVPLTGGEADYNVALATINQLQSSIVGTFTYGLGGNTRSIRTLAYGLVTPDSGDYNTGFTFEVTEQGRAVSLAQTNVKTVFVYGDDVYAGHTSGINISRNNGQAWTETITVSGNALSSNDVQDIYVKANTLFVATDQGVDISTDSGVSFNPTDIGPGKTFNEVVSKIEVSNNYVFAATDSGLKVSTNSGTTFVERTTADGLTANDIMSLALYKQTLFVGTFNGFNHTLNTDVVLNTINGGVDILAIGSVTGLKNFVKDQDYVFDSNGLITWLPSARNLPAAGSSFFVTYNYNRPSTDFFKKYAYEDFGTFIDEWQMPTDAYLGNIFAYLAFEIVKVDRLIIVPVPAGGSAVDYINGINALEDSDIQDLIVLSSNPEVQVVAQFHVDERSAPENARYRVYWTGPTAGQPLGDKDTPASVIGQKQLLKSERVTFLNTPRGTVSYLQEDGRTGTKVVDGSFIAGALAVYYNAQAGGAPNVEIIGKFIPGIRLFAEDIDEFYTQKRLERAGQESLYLIQPAGSLNLPVVVDDLTTDSSSLEKQSPNIVRSKDYINRDVAIQIKNSFQGKLMINPAQHIKNISTFLQSLFNQYRGANVIADIKNISASRSPDRPDTIKIFYAYEAIYTHKYTEGEFFLSIPTG